MITFKQLESFIALADAGTFEQAARNLKIAQSALSRHIAELEQHFSNELLDRSGRRALLTLDGADVLKQCRSVLRDRDAMLRALRSEPPPIRNLLIGVTEITALTWLHRFLDTLDNDFPEIKAKARVEQSGRLRQMLAADELDMIVVPDSPDLEAYGRVWMGRVESHWYCSPKIHPGPAGLSLRELSDKVLLTKEDGTYSGDWPRDNSLSPRVVISCGGWNELLDLLAGGAGLACLPAALVEDFLTEQKIMEVRIEAKAQAVNYVMLTRQGAIPAWKRNVMALAKAACDFNRRYPYTMSPDPDLSNEVVQNA